MGMIFSCSRPPTQGFSLDVIEPQLETGDVMLFATSGSDNYLARLGSWHPSSQSGFLIRLSEGLEGLQLCHSCLTPGEHSGETQLTSLTEFFSESPFDTVIVRRLCEPLNEEQKHKVVTFARECTGERYIRKVTLLMSRTDLPWMCACVICKRWSKRSVERFIISELVIQMLQRTELVEGNNKEYIPLSSRTLYQSSVVVRSFT